MCSNKQQETKAETSPAASAQGGVFRFKTFYSPPPPPIFSQHAHDPLNIFSLVLQETDSIIFTGSYVRFTEEYTELLLSL